jgi:hypothetical protein
MHLGSAKLMLAGNYHLGTLQVENRGLVPVAQHNLSGRILTCQLSRTYWAVSIGWMEARGLLHWIEHLEGPPQKKGVV